MLSGGLSKTQCAELLSQELQLVVWVVLKDPHEHFSSGELNIRDECCSNEIPRLLQSPLNPPVNVSISVQV